MTVMAIDIVDGARGEKTANGYRFTRVAYVESPTAKSGRVDDAARIYEAMNDTGIPDIGDSHPDVLACLLTRVVCTAIDPNQLTLELIYETNQYNYQVITLGQDDISMESTLSQVETTKDYNGANFGALSYTWPIGAVNPHKPTKTDPSDSTKTVTNLLDAPLTLNSELPVAPLYIPGRLLRVRKRVSGKDHNDLEALNEAYQGHVNASTWRGYNPRTWMCTGISWRTTDRRTTYMTDTEFQYKFDTYNIYSVFKDPFNGKVPGDVFTQDSAYDVNQVQREADFDALISTLGITF